MVHITFPDGNIKSFKNNSTGLDVAKGISEGFARNCVAMELDSEIVDLSTRITRDTKIRFITTKDPEALKILRHSAAHVMAPTKPVNLSLIEKTKTLSPRQIRMHGDAVIEIINNTLKVPGDSLPVYPRKKASPLPPQVPKRVKAIKAWRDTVANKLKIDPPLLFNKALLTAIALQNPKGRKSLETIKEMKNWQKNEFGEKIISILQMQDN